jgi:hypothetical protein
VANSSYIHLISGLLLLFLGRRLFWLFVGLTGFIAGFAIAERFFQFHSQLIELIIALGCGLIGVLLAVFLQRLAIAIAGFVAGGLFTLSLLEMGGWNIASVIPFLIGGFIGAILLSLFFDWALIIISSASGALLVARFFLQDRQLVALAFLVLLIIGIVVQARIRPAAKVHKT